MEGKPKDPPSSPSGTMEGKPKDPPSPDGFGGQAGQTFRTRRQARHESGYWIARTEEKENGSIDTKGDTDASGTGDGEADGVRSGTGAERGEERRRREVRRFGDQCDEGNRDSGNGGNEKEDARRRITPCAMTSRFPK